MTSNRNDRDCRPTTVQRNDTKEPKASLCINIRAYAHRHRAQMPPQGVPRGVRNASRRLGPSVRGCAANGCNTGCKRSEKSRTFGTGGVPCGRHSRARSARRPPDWSHCTAGCARNDRKSGPPRHGRATSGRALCPTIPGRGMPPPSAVAAHQLPSNPAAPAASQMPSVRRSPFVPQFVPGSSYSPGSRSHPGARPPPVSLSFPHPQSSRISRFHPVSLHTPGLRPHSETRLSAEFPSPPDSPSSPGTRAPPVPQPPSFLGPPQHLLRPSATVPPHPKYPSKRSAPRQPTGQPTPPRQSRRQAATRPAPRRQTPRQAPSTQTTEHSFRMQPPPMQPAKHQSPKRPAARSVAIRPAGKSAVRPPYALRRQTAGRRLSARALRPDGRPPPDPRRQTARSASGRAPEDPATQEPHDADRPERIPAPHPPQRRGHTHAPPGRSAYRQRCDSTVFPYVSFGYSIIYLSFHIEGAERTDDTVILSAESSRLSGGSPSKPPALRPVRRTLFGTSRVRRRHGRRRIATGRISRRCSFADGRRPFSDTHRRSVCRLRTPGNTRECAQVPVSRPPGRFVRIARNERRPAAKSACARRMQSAVRDGIARTVSQDRSRFGEAAETSAIRQSETAPDAHRPAGRDLSKCPESRPAGRPCGQFANFDSASARPCGLRGRGAPARAAGRDRKRMCRNSHRGNAAGKADAAQRHDNPPRNPPNRDKGAPARAAGRGRERMCRDPHRGNAAGKADAAQRHDNPPRNPPNRDRCAAAADASSGGDPHRRPPPEADAHRPARRPEENPAAG